ncbi:MAG: hypothetical protein AAB378_01670 [Patescibacteria group bacterium]
MKNLFKIILPLLALFAVPVFAQINPFDIKFPVAELGNCGSMDECKVFCDDSANALACLSWAKANGFVKEEQRLAEGDQFERRARETLKNDAGPGGCRSFEECDAFCSREENTDTCFAFAKEHDLAPQEELRKVERRTGPGGCNSQKECDDFCRTPDNAEVCVNFAVQEGKISQEEADFMIGRMKEFSGPGRMGPPEGMEPRGPQPPQIDIEKARKLLETEGGPGGCKTMDECDAFCGTPGNDAVCLQFAVDHGLMPAQELERAKKMMNAEGPGGCRGRECENYCQNPEHGEECINFAVREGFMDPAEAEQARKFTKLAKEPGPGGCTGRQACDEFCSRPENGEACFAFAKERGLISENDIQRMEKEKSIRGKLEKQGGPGGCKNEQECRSYCEDTAHFDECAAFSVGAGMMSPDRAKQMLKSFMDTEMRQGEGVRSMLGEGAGARMGSPSGMENEYNERLQMFEGYRQGFQQREDYCADLAHADECRSVPTQKGVPQIDAHPQRSMMPPQEFQGKLGEFQMFGAPSQGEREGQVAPMQPGEFRPSMPLEGFKMPEGMIKPGDNMPYNSFKPQEGEYRVMQTPADMIQPLQGGVMQTPPPSAGTEQFAPGTEPMPVQPIMNPASEPTSAPSSYIPFIVGIPLFSFMDFLR